MHKNKRRYNSTWFTTEDGIIYGAVNPVAEATYVFKEIVFSSSENKSKRGRKLDYQVAKTKQYIPEHKLLEAVLYSALHDAAIDCNNLNASDAYTIAKAKHDDAIEWINSNNDEPFSVYQVCHYLGVTKTTINRIRELIRTEDKEELKRVAHVLIKSYSPHYTR